jgi:hypothetical protein
LIFCALSKVSWFRKAGNETHLLTVGLNTYSRDNRISLNYVLHNNWQLRIQDAHTADAGFYQCEVSTHPPIHREVFVKVVGMYDIHDSVYFNRNVVVLDCSTRPRTRKNQLFRDRPLMDGPDHLNSTLVVSLCL